MVERFEARVVHLGRWSNASNRPLPPSLRLSRGLLAAAERDVRIVGSATPTMDEFSDLDVGEPRLQISLIGSPRVKVDLKFVMAADLDDRVEDGVVLWQRTGIVDAELGRRNAFWLMPDPQWIEDRLWVWSTTRRPTSVGVSSSTASTCSRSSNRPFLDRSSHASMATADLLAFVASRRSRRTW
jgi:hypothetical protein